MTCLLGHAYYNEDNEPRFLRFTAPGPVFPIRGNARCQCDATWACSPGVSGKPNFPAPHAASKVLSQGSHSGGVAGERMWYYIKRTLGKGAGKENEPRQKSCHTIRGLMFRCTS
jgi:hypothetical protein